MGGAPGRGKGHGVMIRLRAAGASQLVVRLAGSGLASGGQAEDTPRQSPQHED